MGYLFDNVVDHLFGVGSSLGPLEQVEHGVAVSEEPCRSHQLLQERLHALSYPGELIQTHRHTAMYVGCCVTTRTLAPARTSRPYIHVAKECM